MPGGSLGSFSWKREVVFLKSFFLLIIIPFLLLWFPSPFGCKSHLAHWQIFESVILIGNIICYSVQHCISSTGLNFWFYFFLRLKCIETSD